LQLSGSAFERGTTIPQIRNDVRLRRVVDPDELHPESVTTWPRITIVTPTYNRDDFLEEAILSVFNQDYPNLEYIIVDGGSTNPRVLEIIRKYEDRLAWWISEPDGGHAEAVRKGFDRSTGEIMAWHCSDDAYLPGTLKAVGEIFARRREAEVVFGNTHVLDGNGRFVREYRAVPFSRLSFITASGFHQPSSFWRRSLYDRVGGKVGGENFEFNVYEPNVDLFFRFANADARFVLLRKPMCSVRVHPDQTCTRERDNVRAHMLKVLRREFPFWGRPGVYHACRLAMRLRQLAWYLRQGDSDYVARNLLARLRVGRRRSVA
jgi:glycosyltransferase involved in cell wall biosynthesis